MVERPITVRDYQRLRRAVGWYRVDNAGTAQSLANTLYQVCAIAHDKVVGYGRIVGDACVEIYIQDVMVLPRYQGRGIGSRIMDALMKYVASKARKYTFIGLMAAHGRIRFYERFGFKRRPEDAPGMYITWKSDEM